MRHVLLLHWFSGKAQRTGWWIGRRDHMTVIPGDKFQADYEQKTEKSTTQKVLEMTKHTRNSRKQCKWLHPFPWKFQEQQSPTEKGAKAGGLLWRIHEHRVQEFIIQTTKELKKICLKVGGGNFPDINLWMSRLKMCVCENTWSTVVNREAHFEVQEQR